MSLDHLHNSITEPLVCAECHATFSRGETDSPSLQAYSQLDVGFTDRGIQIWCRRHQLNVCHVDFDGAVLDADMRCLIPKSPSA